MVSKTFVFLIALMVIILVISLLAFFGILPSVKASDCVRDQYFEIDRIEEKIKSAKDTNNEYIEPFEMKWCSRCIWYDSASSKLKIIFLDEKNPMEYPVKYSWGSDFDSQDKALVSPGSTYRFHITSVELKCLDCENRVGKCEV